MPIVILHGKPKVPNSGQHKLLYTYYSYLSIIINQNQQQNEVYFNHLVGLITNYDVPVKLSAGFSWPKQHSTRKRIFSPPNWI
jgi:hypothetical protein